MSVFDEFPTQAYTFLELNQGGVLGNTIKAEYPAQGILKERKGLTTNNNMELMESTSTLHTKPSDSFLALINYNMVGHGIRALKNGSTVTYRITGQVEGFDFDTNVLDFYKLTLKKEDLAS